MIWNHKKIILWAALLVWIGAAILGYLFYRQAIRTAESRWIEKARRDVESLAPPYRKIFRLMQEIRGEKGGLVALGEVDPLTAHVRKSIGHLPNLLYAEVADHNGRVLVQMGQGRYEVTERLPVLPGNAERPSVTLHVLASGAMALHFFEDVIFFGQKVGTVQVAIASAAEIPAGRYRMLLAGWIVLLPVVLLLLILAVYCGKTALRIRAARRVFVSLMAIDLFHREEKARRRIMRAAVIHHILAAEKAAAGKAALDAEQRIGPYLLKQRIGRGGMAELFIAEKTRENDFRKIVALKRILPHLSDNPEFTMRFIREARIAALLQHSNIVATNDFGKYDDNYIIAMEYVRGLNLAEIMARLKRPLETSQAVYIAAQICRGLYYSHNKSDDATGEPLNIVHRDISPQNIMISYEGEVKISDFGIAKAALYSGFTQAGAIVGKLSYMAPEQVVDGESVDCRTDIYALGILFYELLSGSPLFRFGSAVQAIAEIPKVEVRPIAKLAPDIPEPLSRIVMKALEKDKTRRYQTAQAMLDDLETLRRTLSIPYSMTDLSNFMKRHFSHMRPRDDVRIPPAHLFRILCKILSE